MKNTRMTDQDERDLQECLKAREADRKLGKTIYEEEQKRIQEQEE